MGMLRNIAHSIKSLFKRETPKTKEVKTPGELPVYTDVRDSSKKYQLFHENPNVGIFTIDDNIIYTLNVYTNIYRNNYQFRSLIDQIIKRIAAFDVRYAPASPLYKTKTNRSYASERVNRYIQRQLRRVIGYNNNTGYCDNMGSLVHNLCSSLITGKAIIQKVFKTKPNGKYDLETGYYELEKLRLCDPNLFEFLYDTNEMVFVDPITTEISKVDPRQFLLHVNNGSYLNPNGESVIGECGYRLHYTLNQLYEDFREFSRRHGFASYDIIGKTRQNSAGGFEPPSQVIMEHATQIASIIQSGSVLCHTDDIEVSQIEEKIRHPFDYIKSIELIERSISKYIIGSTAVTQNSETSGSRALGEVHERSSEALIEDYAKDVQFSINELIKDLLELNRFDTDTINLPKIKIEYRREEVDAVKANIALQAVDKGLPINVTELLQLLKLQSPVNMDTQITTSGYITPDGEEVNGIFNINNSNNSNDEIIAVEEKIE